MFSHFLHIFSSVSPKRIKRVFYKIKYSELMFFIYEEFYKLKYCSTVVYMVPRA
jgi:hypothetical protein